jgi:hypothetical protein
MIDGLIPITDEQAKLGQEILKTFRGLGSFLERALGSTPEDLVGYFGGDRLRVRRAENIVRMMCEAQSRLATMGIKEMKPATLSIALPILQGAADEDREELVDIWARLFASAMDATKNNVRYSFISAVREMDLPDAKIMHYLYSQKVTRIRRSGGGSSNADTNLERISSGLGGRNDDVEVSIDHLEGLGFLITSPNDKNIWFPNAKFREFMRACYPELDA